MGYSRRFVGASLFIFLFLFLASTTYALKVEEYTVEIDVDDRGLSQVTTNIILDSRGKETTLDFYAYKPTSVIIYDEAGEVQHAVVEDKIIIKPQEYKPDYEITVVYLTNSLTSKTNGEWVFDYSDPNLLMEPYSSAATYGIVLYLPETVRLKAATEGGVYSAYGKSIAISWISERSDAPIGVGVKYEIEMEGLRTDRENLWKYLTIFAFILFFLTLIFRPLRKKVTHDSSKSQKDILATLDENQAKIVKILLDQKDHKLKQRQLEAETSLHKSSLSRYLKKLKQKKIVELIPSGNTNIVRLTKEFLKK